MCCCEWALAMAAENAKSAQTHCGNGQPGLQIKTVTVPLGMRGHGCLQPAMNVNWPLFRRLPTLCRRWRDLKYDAVKAAVLWSNPA